MTASTPIEELREEHASLLNDAREIQGAVSALGAGTGAAWADIGGTLADSVEMLRRGLLIHFCREEVGLFPEARRMIAGPARAAKAIGRFLAGESEEDVGAHAALASRTEDTLALLREIEERGKLFEQSLWRLRTLVGITISLLERHLEKEESIVFPMIERSLDPVELREVRKRMSGLGSAHDLVPPSGASCRPDMSGE